MTINYSSKTEPRQFLGTDDPITSDYWGEKEIIQPSFLSSLIYSIHHLKTARSFCQGGKQTSTWGKRNIIFSNRCKSFYPSIIGICCISFVNSPSSSVCLLQTMSIISCSEPIRLVILYGNANAFCMLRLIAPPNKPPPPLPL